MLTFEQIKELIEIVSERELQGLEVERSGFRLKIDGQGGSAPSAAASAAGASAPAPAAPAAAEPTAAEPGPAGATPAAAPAGEGEEEGPPAGSHVIKSPIVGTFYRAPSPDADPFVQEGDRVEKGQVLCIVEAMKLMNEIESEVDGTVLEIYPDDAQPVEFGEPLFAVKPA